MSFWYSDSTDDRPQSVATGEAPLFEILTAAREQMRLVENSTAAGEALTRAYDQRIRDIEAATGETLVNPMREAASDADRRFVELSPGSTSFMRDVAPDLFGEKTAAFTQRLSEIAQRHPEKATAIGADRPVERDAEALARHADERMAKAFASRDGLGKWAALLAGGMVGSGYDPLQVGTWLIGGGPGGARTIGGRILTTVATEAAANAFGEAVQQPQVQAWRKQAGLPNGMEEAVKNVAFAGLLGGALGGAGQGVAEGVGRLLLRADVTPDAAARVLADAPDANPKLKAALDGDARAAADLLRPIRDTLPAEARGAIDALEAARIADEARPPAASPRVHDDAMAAAIRAAQRSETFTHEPDPAQVSRIVDQLVPETATANVKGKAGAGETDLAEFLMRAGGVKDFKGELDAIGATKISRRFVGRLVREDGMPLDQARLRAAEAGYFDRLYGTPDEAAEKSTIADLLDALDSGAREDARIRVDDDGGRAYAEQLVHELAARAGPAVDDRLILQAAELANAENIAPAEALDRVLIADDMAKETASPPSRFDPSDTRGGLDDPLGFPDEDAFSRADLEDLPEDMDIPFFDDEPPIGRDALIEHLDNLDHLTAVVEACRA